MVKKCRDRRDQYYRLARESGYRSRAAFKLLQLDSKLNFLSSARCVVDLCAAPGGWLQAAAERMPGGSMIIGVDLVPIRPLHGITTLQGDITTQECRAAILREMTGWLADVVLHDGSPNIGGNWSREAFDQNCLVLSAFKLASTILKRGGSFVTKVFRSQDYTALLGVFRKLFSKVQATKPAASRSESAEIFVVCMNFQPLKGDAAAELFDPQRVFASTSAPTPSSMVPVKGGEAAAAAVLRERKRLRRTREGYDDNTAGNLAYGSLSALKFVTCNDGTHAKMIAESGSIKLDDPQLEEHPLTTAEIKECCRDVRVLGRRELRLLLAWRRKMGKMLERLEKKKDGATEDKDKEPEEIDEGEEEHRTEMQIQALKDAEGHRQKKKLKKARETKLAARKRMTAAPEAAKFRSVHDLLLEEEGGQNELFSLKQLRSAADLDAALDDPNAEELAISEDEEEEDDNFGQKPRRKTVAYKVDEEPEYDDEELVGKKPGEDDDLKKKKREKKGKKAKKRREEEANEEDDVVDDMDVDSTPPGECPLAVSCETTAERDRRCLKQWEDTVSGFISGDSSKKGGKRQRQQSSSSDDSSSDESEDLADWELEAMAKIKGKEKGEEKPKKKLDKKVKKDELDEDDSSDEEEKGGKKPAKMKNEADPVTLALGAKLVSSRKTRREMIEAGYNRWSFGAEEGLPKWFTENEKHNCHPTLPLTRDEVQFYKDRLKALDARPIHKVAEARGRKKRRMMGKIEAARKEAEKLAENDQMTEAEKQATLKRIYRSARSSARKENRVQVVMARGRATGRRTVRPPGVRGRYKVVDPRMKKDLRAQNNAAKRQKKHRR